jgi:hypothetical protein
VVVVRVVVDMAGPLDSLFVLNALADLVKPKQAGSE